MIVEGHVIEVATLARLRDWQRAGGLLIVGDVGPIETVADTPVELPPIRLGSLERPSGEVLAP